MKFENSHVNPVNPAILSKSFIGLQDSQDLQIENSQFHSITL